MRIRKIFYLSLVIIFISLLNGCSSLRKDGPPPYDVDVSKIKDAEPKMEPKSKYGNLVSYTVFGKRYYTMRSSKNYHERGIASWYGTMFHKHNTSSGEPYNMLAMTAAHKTLPLPTYVQVTNLENGRKVILKVNDRGPFESNRIIDLSYVAAKKLGILGRGTAKVDVKAIDPVLWANQSYPNRSSTMVYAQNTSKKPNYFRSKSAGNSYFLQVGAFKNRTHAEQLKYRLSKVIASSEITITEGYTNNLYHVKIGPIKDLNTENYVTKRLKSIGLSSKKTTASNTEV